MLAAHLINIVLYLFNPSQEAGYSKISIEYRYCEIYVSAVFYVMFII